MAIDEFGLLKNVFGVEDKPEEPAAAADIELEAKALVGPMGKGFAMRLPLPEGSLHEQVAVQLTTSPPEPAHFNPDWQISDAEAARTGYLVQGAEEMPATIAEGLAEIDRMLDGKPRKRTMEEAGEVVGVILPPGYQFHQSGPLQLDPHHGQVGDRLGNP